MRFRYWEVPLHLLFWGLSFWILNESFAMVSIQETELNGERETIIKKEYLLLWPIVFSLMSKSILVYANIFVLFPSFTRRKKWMPYLLKVMFLLGLSLGIEAALNLAFFPKREQGNALIFFITPPLNLLLTALFWGLSTAYVLGKNYMKGERQKQALLQEKLSAELNFLKAQIHPHFLFNTLNNLFAIAERNQNQELSAGIAELSNLMRYMLYEAKGDRVPLIKEIDYLKSVIEIQQLRLSEEDEVLIALNVEGEVYAHKIAPLILIPFVENAFKHGIRLRQASFIKIDCKVKSDYLTFKVINSQFPPLENDLDQHAGIGLENVKKRLNLIYPQRHQLSIVENGDTFSILLELELNT